MRTSRVDLKAYFRDGELPTGNNFSTLIDSMVHVDEFESWRKTGEIDLGNGKWRIYVDANDRFVIDPDTPSMSRPALALWHEGGWVGMQGRIGTFDQARDAACGGPASELQVPLNVRADGKWQSVLSNLEGCQAFELVAKVAGPPASGKQGISRAVALTSPAGSDVSIQQAPAHRSLRRNLFSLALLILFLAMIMGLPEKYLERGRAGNEKVKAATEQVEKSRRTLAGLEKSRSIDIVDIYTETGFRPPGKATTLTWGAGRREIEKIGSIQNNDPDVLRATIYTEVDGKETKNHFSGTVRDVSVKGSVKGVEATMEPEFEKRMTHANNALREAKNKLEEAEKAPIFPRVIERFVSVAKPVGILGIVVIAFSILISHMRHRAAIRVKWRKQKNKLFGGDTKYDLCLRTGRNYGVDADGVPVKIHYHITKLWA